MKGTDQSLYIGLQNKAKEQLEGQVASAKISLARLSSPQLYYVLSGNDLTLDINNPKAPKIVCMGNNPQKTQTYGAVLSLFVNRLIDQVTPADVQENYLMIKADVRNLIDTEIGILKERKAAETPEEPTTTTENEVSKEDEEPQGPAIPL